jgi:hypothetical protein
MKRFISVDERGFVYGYASGLEAPDQSWTEIDFDASEAMTSPNRFRFVDGRIVDTGLPKLPPKPHMRWVDGQWVDPRGLEAVKSDKWNEIKSRRDEEEHGGFDWDGSRFDSDQESQSKIIGAVQLAGLSDAAFAIDWTLQDNTVRALDKQQMIAVGRALAQHITSTHETGRQLRQQIELASSIEQVQAVNWP